MALRDHVLLVDGPLKGRRFCTDRTPCEPLDFHAALAPDGRLLACEDEPVPNVPYEAAEFRYVPVIAPDGHPSRDDLGFLRFYLVGRADA